MCLIINFKFNDFFIPSKPKFLKIENPYSILNLSVSWVHISGFFHILNYFFRN